MKHADRRTHNYLLGKIFFLYFYLIGRWVVLARFDLGIAAGARPPTRRGQFEAAARRVEAEHGDASRRGAFGGAPAQESGQSQ